MKFHETVDVFESPSFSHIQEFEYQQLKNERDELKMKLKVVEDGNMPVIRQLKIEKQEIKDELDQLRMQFIHFKMAERPNVREKKVKELEGNVKDLMMTIQN